MNVLLYNLLCMKHFEIYILKLLSIAVEQAVACAPVKQRARIRFPVGTSFLGVVFFGVFPHL